MNVLRSKLSNTARIAMRTLKEPVHLILDWDGTLTTKDTMALLGELPRARNIRIQRSEAPSVPDSGSQWSQFADAYIKDYSAHKSQYFPTDPKGLNAYSNWLESLRPIEDASVKRVQDAGYFRGVTIADVVTVARNSIDSGTLRLRNGWTDLFEMFLPSSYPPPGSKVSILSVNWSETFIRCSLDSAASSLPETFAKKTELRNYIKDLPIHANEIDGLDTPLGSSGRLEGNIRTARDKLAQMPIRELGTRNTSRPTMPRVVYIGDSATDFECLRHADVCVWMSNSTDYEAEFQRVFAPLRLSPRRPDDLHGFNEGNDLSTCTWAFDLAQVADLLAHLRR